jgi:hypothetical protein
MFKPTDAKTPEEYISSLEEPRRTEVQKIHDFIRETLPQYKPYILSGMIGYGSYHYKYASGREGDWCVIGLSSRKNYISLYICAVKDGKYVAESFKDNLPKADIGKSCVRFKKFEDITFPELRELLLLGSEAEPQI